MMKTLFLIIIILYFPLITLAGVNRFSNNEVFFDGKVTPKAVVALTQTLRDGDTLFVRSEGGDVASGITLAHYLSTINFDIFVEDYCLSSCANYIFTFANKKTINGIVGFHGCLTAYKKYRWEYDQYGLVKNLGQAGLKKLNDQMVYSSIEELLLFSKKKININIFLSSQPESNKYFCNEISNFVIPSIAIMESFGIKNITRYDFNLGNADEWFSYCLI